jgi:hypothetical protein
MTIRRIFPVLSFLLLAAMILAPASRVAAQQGVAQQGAAPDSAARFGISFSGYVRSDAIFDSRQSETLREGGIMLYPKPIEWDQGTHGIDVMESPSLTMLVLHTRLAGTITGPQAFGAKASAYMEGEFFGVSDADANGFRVRHAYVTLDWGSTRLMVGQYWHPMFVTSVIPVFNFAAPFIPYARNPQLRLTHTFGGLSLSAAALMQSDFKSVGPDATGKATRSASFLRNAAMPMVDLQCAYTSDALIAGVGGDVKTLKPKLRDAAGASDETITSIMGSAYMRAVIGPVTWKLQGVFGQNLSDVTMLGGFAARQDDTLAWTNRSAASVWTELSTGKDLMFCLFAGLTKQDETDDVVQNGATVYGMAPMLDMVMRVAPSVHWTSGKIKAVLEAEWTAADWIESYVDNSTLKPFVSWRTVDNWRLDAAIFYYF